ncbi:unnamed protein product [Didymodactylos carnosus]|uniref:Serine aminopeptidase S33 domain-containing protein n=1 Tax=Didymodactylos carnosus TaxID=1234261 RepID=A0A814S0Y8_9BILA|nr:unnamed protein product [Didymodactylos carnosus]CAF3904896.1 unnamed protein product [Didymodactylos carnosus]
MKFLVLLCIFIFIPWLFYYFHFSLLIIILSFLLPIIIVVQYISYLFLHPKWHISTRNPKNGLPVKISGSAAQFYGSKITNPKIDFNIDFTEVEIDCLDKWPVLSSLEDANDNHLTNLNLKHKSHILRAWFVLPNSNNNDIKTSTCILAVHGAGRDRRNFMRHLPIFHSSGYAVLLIDCREHGISDSHGMGIGWASREAIDVINAAYYIKYKLNYNKCVVLSTSQGASASIIAAAYCGPKYVSNPLIDAVIAENPYSSKELLMTTILDEFLGHNLYPLSLILNSLQRLFSILIVFIVNIRLGLSISKTSSFLLHSINHHHLNPIQVIHEISPRPILLMHGTSDRTIPCQHSELLYNEARNPKKIWFAEGALHTAIYDKYPELWKSTVLNFLKEYNL